MAKLEYDDSDIARINDTIGDVKDLVRQAKSDRLDKCPSHLDEILVRANNLSQLMNLGSLVPARKVAGEILSKP